MSLPPVIVSSSSLYLMVNFSIAVMLCMWVIWEFKSTG
ncbi:protein of unknown function [Pararobbsia alpina]